MTGPRPPRGTRPRPGTRPRRGTLQRRGTELPGTALRGMPRLGTAGTRIDLSSRRLGGAGQAGALDTQSGVAVLVTVVAAVASTALAVSKSDIFHAVTARPATFAALVALTIVLQLLAVPVYGRGSISISGMALLAAAFNLGVGPGMAAAALA